MAKAVATEAVARIVDRAMQLSGGAAVVEGHPLARLYRRIRAWRIAEGTTEILRLTVARRLLAFRAVRPSPRPSRTKESNPMRPNRLRELLRAGKPTLGTHIHSAWPATIELAGHAGMFDYVEFAGEYAPYDLFALENLARAVDTFPHMSAMMKIEQQPRTYRRRARHRLRHPESALRRPAHAGRRRGVRQRGPGRGAGPRRHPRRGHAPRRRLRRRRGLACLRAGPRRRRGGHHDREGAGRGATSRRCWP